MSKELILDEWKGLKGVRYERRIYCRDCDHHFSKFCWCSLHCSYMEDDDFCSRAVPKMGREREK